jgi:hypothetical protein
VLALAVAAAGLLWAGCGGDDDDAATDDVAATGTPTADPSVISSTLPPNEIVEADHYYADAVCTEFVRWARAQTPSEDEDEQVDREAALAGLVAGLEAIQPPDAYAGVHETLLGLAREAAIEDQRSTARLLGMPLGDDHLQERLQAAANDEQSCQRFQEVWGLPAFYGRVL